MLTLKADQLPIAQGSLLISCFSPKKTIAGPLTRHRFRKSLALDSLGWVFLTKTLSVFDFGQSFNEWINTFYNNIKSCVINNGFSSTHFDVLRGVRQGDPLSGSLFMIALEILVVNIRSSEDIRGIMVSDGKEIKLTALADDMTTFARDKKSTDKLLKTIDNCELFSGLKLNRSKLEAIYLGPPLAHFANNLEVSTSIKILGIFFS